MKGLSALPAIIVLAKISASAIEAYNKLFGGSIWWLHGLKHVFGQYES
jgi:hypothetical protein